jgi:hypothetical protein
VSALTFNQRLLLRLIVDHGPISEPALRREEVAQATAMPGGSFRDRVLTLVGMGYAYRAHPGNGKPSMVSATAVGAAALEAPAAPITTADEAATVRSIYVTDGGTYTGGELQPFTGRPGAMDAFTLPSIQGGKRVARKAPAIMSVSPTPRATL